jgi:hypothetical protein
MLPAFSLAVLKDGKPALQRFQGFTGYNGWRLHPTRGWKKMEGYIATTKSEVLKQHTTSKPNELSEVDAELQALLSDLPEDVLEGELC